MYSLINNITITQRQTQGFPNRNKVLRLDFLTSYEWESTWANMTQKGKITFPKNLYYKDESNALNPLNGVKINVGGFSGEPLLMRGDHVVIEAGYQYPQPSIVRTVDDTAIIAEGWISKVHSKIPIEIDIEDNMWLLKQVSIPTKTFKESDTIESILKLICDTVNAEFKTSLTYNALTKTNFGTIITGNETAAQLLDRIHMLFGMTSYFRGNELRCGVLNYMVSEATEQVFVMYGKDGNVPADGQNLEWERKDDIVLSAVARNTIEQETGETCKDGSAKTKTNRLEVLVTFKNGDFIKKVIGKGERVPDNNEGERRTFHFPSAKTTDELYELCKAQLLKYYYDGFRGDFTAFGIPFVKHGDNVRLKNPRQPEQDGLYKVKKVVSTGGTEGMRQRITLDFEIK